MQPFLLFILQNICPANKRAIIVYPLYISWCVCVCVDACVCASRVCVRMCYTQLVHVCSLFCLQLICHCMNSIASHKSSSQTTQQPHSANTVLEQSSLVPSVWMYCATPWQPKIVCIDSVRNASLLHYAMGEWNPVITWSASHWRYSVQVEIRSGICVDGDFVHVFWMLNVLSFMHSN